MVGHGELKFIATFLIFITYINQVNYSFLTKNQVAIYFAWQMISGKVARLTWQLGTPFSVKPQKKLPGNSWQIGTLRDWG
jgi:hypothetical protein